MRVRVVVPLVGLVAGLVLAGCGGGSSSSTTGASGASGTSGAQGAALSKSEFVAKGNAICAKGSQEINAEAKKIFTSNQAPSQATQEKFVTDTVIPSIQQQIDGLDALPAPSGDEDQVQAIVDAAQSALDKAKQDPSLLTDQAQGGDPFAQANKLADDYGLTKCGSDSGG
ncbi:MAG: hypothetical protein ACJ75I_01390 [Solirubrobacterales bacterium]